MGVTQVVRGSDLLSSSAPQIYLFRILGFQVPKYLHLPMLITEDGVRLAKRDKAADMGFLRQQLTGPEPLIGYIAWLLGQIRKPEPLKATDLLTGQGSGYGLPPSAAYRSGAADRIYRLAPGTDPQTGTIESNRPASSVRP